MALRNRELHARNDDDDRLSGMGDADVQSDYTLHQTHRRHRTLVHQTVREGLQVTGGIAILYSGTATTVHSNLPERIGSATVWMVL